LLFTHCFLVRFWLLQRRDFASGLCQSARVSACMIARRGWVRLSPLPPCFFFLWGALGRKSVAFFLLYFSNMLFPMLGVSKAHRGCPPRHRSRIILAAFLFLLLLGCFHRSLPPYWLKGGLARRTIKLGRSSSLLGPFRFALPSTALIPLSQPS